MSDRPAECKAYHVGQQWFCDQCGMTWDIDDDDPPECHHVALVKDNFMIDTTFIKKEE